ncbi:MAG TPA: hypothetical protein VEH02_01945, partial [Pseudolabrys sp.]|nr:hypothetical protein [Pseudolabrys sp.]
MFRGKWLWHGFRYKDYSNDIALAQKRGAKRGAVAANFLGFTPGIFRIRKHIMNVNDFTFRSGSPNDAASILRYVSADKKLFQACVLACCNSIARHPVQILAIALEKPGLIGIAQPCCRLDKRIEHRLQIESR